MKLTFIGLGAMGYPMAGHAAKEHETTVWNRTRETAERHALEFRSNAVEDLETSVAGAEAVLTILPTSREVDEIADRLIGRLREGTLWIDATSGDPVTSRKTAARLAAKGIAFVDAPVTGGTNGAAAGTLTVMVGGSSENYVRASSVLKTFGSRIVHVGEVGAGHAVKAVNNAMLAANLVIASECLLTLKRLGIDLRSALEVLNSGSGRSFASQELLPKRILEGEWPVTFKLGLHEKDVRIAAAMAHEAHMAAPALAQTTQLFTAGMRSLGRDADYIEIAKFVAKMNADEW